MLKKITCAVCAIVLMCSIVSESVLAATVINQDVSLEAPIKSAMETAAEAQAVAAQLTGPGSSANLSDDNKEGSFSLKVVASGETAGYAQYTLAPSDAFDADSFGTISLWIKPGAGAHWIEFYTNGVKLRSDSDGDGRFEIGEDLKSGEWTKLTLNLLDADSALSQGDGLAVCTNDNSVFLFDGVLSQNTEVRPLDLAAYTGTSARINNDSLEFNPNAPGTAFDTATAVLTSSADTTNGDILKGKLAGIKIDSDFADISGSSAEAAYTTPYGSTSKYEITDDGKTIYYLKSSSETGIYKLNVDTGESVLCCNAPYAIQKMVASPSGNYLLLYCRYQGYDYYNNYIYEYNTTTSTFTLIKEAYSNSVNVYYISDSGTYYYTYGGNLYRNVSSICGGSLTLFASSNNVWAATYTTSLFVNSSALAYTHSENITSIKFNLDGTGVYFTSSSGLYYYTVSTKAVKKLSTAPNAISRVLGDGRLLSSGYIYDPATGQKETVPAYYYNLSGDVGVNSSNVYKRENTFTNKYLLSFDGRHTWYSYKGGAWTAVCKNTAPTTDNFMDYGMSKSEVNALTADDFAPLYSGGNEIYSVDAAIYFASGSPNQTPSIKSIKVITDKSSYYTAAGLTASPLYTAKSVSFAGSGWKTINRIYPVEICPKAASLIYFFYADGKYQYYDGTQWVAETDTEIADLISDTQANWIALKEMGMTARELRAVPKAALTAQLAGEDFSVVYCMRVADKSTAGYYSRITADYTEDYFAGASLTVTVTLSDGTVKSLAGLTDTQAEDFMAWLKSGKRSSNFYTIKTGTTSTVFNYYMIQYVTVEEG